MAEREIPIRDSSRIKQVIHDEETQVLTVHFKKGGSYTYAGVDTDKALGFASAESPGRYLDANILGQHVHTKV